MSAVSYLLGAPPAAELRGGDCRARDLHQGRNVHGPHRFAVTTHCRISNGLLRLTVGASGAAPSLTVEAYRGAVTIGDLYVDLYSDLYGGTLSAPAWQAMGTITLDSPSLSALLTGVRIVRLTAERVTIRLASPLIGDAFVTLRRGFRAFSVQHGNTRRSVVTTTRRIRWTDTPSPVGTATTARVEETSPAIDGFPRFVAALDLATANAGAFSMTTTATRRARFGAGIGTAAARDTPGDIHAQLADNTRARIVLVGS